MSSLQKTVSPRKKRVGRGASKTAVYRKQFQWKNELGEVKRETLSLGRRTAEEASRIQSHIANLLDAKRYSARIPEPTRQWLREIERTSPELFSRLKAVGLLSTAGEPTVGEFVDLFVERKKATVGAGTAFLCEQAADDLRRWFKSKKLHEVTVADAKAYWHSLITGDDTRRKLSDNTARRRLGRVREIFNDAVEQELIARNPFVLKSLPVSVGAGKKLYIPAETIVAVIDHLPADKLEWKLLFAFGRFVGCRMPSEIRNLTWDDVDEGSNTILLKSPKTASKGKPDRLVPIFPEIRELLREQSDAAARAVQTLGREAAADVAIYVFPTLRKHANTAVTAAKVVKAAGFSKWPKFWNSLRASCETDLMDRYGLRQACAWIGNTPAVAMKHYALMRKSDYADIGSEGRAAESAAEDRRIRAHSSARDLTNVKNPGKTKVASERATPHGFEHSNESLVFRLSAADRAAGLDLLLELWNSADSKQKAEILSAAKACTL